jgi:hypothetical protein
MKNSAICALFVATICLFAAVFAEAQDTKMYSWTDENGTVHFSDTKPQGQNFEEKRITQDTAGVAGTAYQQGDSGSSTAQQKREEIARKSQEAQVNSAINNVQCSAWQAELERIEPNRRVYFTNDAGETERMDDVERVNRVAELKAQIARNCR